MTRRLCVPIAAMVWVVLVFAHPGAAEGNGGFRARTAYRPNGQRRVNLQSLRRQQRASLDNQLVRTALTSARRGKSCRELVEIGRRVTEFEQPLLEISLSGRHQAAQDAVAALATHPQADRRASLLEHVALTSKSSTIATKAIKALIQDPSPAAQKVVERVWLMLPAPSTVEVRYLARDAMQKKSGLSRADFEYGEAWRKSSMSLR
jgi:hypothetical protein